MVVGWFMMNYKNLFSTPFPKLAIWWQFVELSKISFWDHLSTKCHIKKRTGLSISITLYYKSNTFYFRLISDLARVVCHTHCQLKLQILHDLKDLHWNHAL